MINRGFTLLVLVLGAVDRHIDHSAYMRIRTPRPRAFLKEQRTKLRAID